MKMLGVFSRISVVMLLSQCVAFAQSGNTVWKKTVTRQIDLGAIKKTEVKLPANKTREMTLLETLVTEARAGRITAYSNFDRSIIAPNDNNYTINPQTYRETVTDPVTNAEITRVRKKELDYNIHIYRTQEEWSYDPATGITHIQITDIAPVREVYGDDGELRGIQAMFWLKYKDAIGIINKYETTHPNSKLTEAIWNDNFKTGNTGGKPVCNALRWIDLPQQPEDTIKHRLTELSNDILLSQWLVYAVKDGRIVAYDTSSIDLKTRCTAKYISVMTDPVIDSVTVINPLDGTESIKERVREIDFHTVQQYKLLENWKFDVNTGRTEIRTLAIAPVRDFYYDAGIYTRSGPMFWLRFSDITGIIGEYEQYHPENTIAAHVWANYFYTDVKPEVIK